MQKADSDLKTNTKTRPFAGTIAMAAASLSLAVASLPFFTSSVSADDTATPAVTPAVTGPFTECPAIGADTTGCGFLISLPQTGSATVTASGQGPYDGHDDTLVGIVNNTDQAISTVTLSSSSDIFGFDGDGICADPYDGQWTNTCPYGTAGYEGPGTSFSNISGDKKSGTLHLSPALEPGAHTFFSLESDLTGAGFVIPAKFTVVKSVTSTGPYYAGSTSTPIDYSISATNDTGAQAGNVTIADSAPPNTTLVTSPPPGCPPVSSPIVCNFTNSSGNLDWAFTGVPGGTTVTVSFSVTPNANAAPSVSNTAIWSGSGCLPPAPTVAGASVAPMCSTNQTTTTVTAPIPLLITASNTTSAYGTAGPAVTPGYTGLTGGDTQPSTPPTCSTVPPVTTTTAVGTYTGHNVCSGAADPKYTITYAPGNAAVTPAPVVVTASSGTMPYGGTVPAITPSYAGLLNGDTASVLTNTPTCSTTATSSSNVGSYPSSCAGAAADDYTFTYVPGTVGVTAVPLVITASSASVTVGAGAPTITAGYQGFANGDSATKLTTQPTCSTTYTSTSVVGTYPSSCTGAADPNYTITYVPGTVTAAAVATAPATVTPTTTPVTAPATAPVTAPAIAFTGALLSDEWIAGAAGILLGIGLVLVARRRRDPRPAE